MRADTVFLTPVRHAPHARCPVSFPGCSSGTTQGVVLKPQGVGNGHHQRAAVTSEGSIWSPLLQTSVDLYWSRAQKNGQRVNSLMPCADAGTKGIRVAFRTVKSKLILNETPFPKCLRGARKTDPGFNRLLPVVPI